MLKLQSSVRVFFVKILVQLLVLTFILPVFPGLQRVYADDTPTQLSTDVDDDKKDEEPLPLLSPSQDLNSGNLNFQSIQDGIDVSYKSFANDREEAAQDLRKALFGEKARSRFDAFSLLQQEAFPHPHPDYVRADNLTIQVVEDVKDREEVRATLYAKDFNHSENSSFQHTAVSHQKPLRFNLLHQGVLINRFLLSSRSILFFGRFIVFIETDTYSPSSKTQNISFIDLEEFKNALGRTDLPIFRLPLELESKAMALSISSGRLVVHGEAGHKFFLQTDVLNLYSSLQYPAFNLMVNLLKEATYKKTAAMVDSFNLFFERTAQLAASSIEGQMEGSDTVIEALTQRGAQSQEYLKASAQFYHPESGLTATQGRIKKLENELSDTLPTETEKKAQLEQKISEAKCHEEELLRRMYESDSLKPKTGEEGTKEFHENVTVRRAIEASLSSVGTVNLNARKVMARLRLLWANLSLPQPRGAATLKEALVSFAMTTQVPEGQRVHVAKEAFLQLINSRRFKQGTLLAGAAAAGFQYPEAFSNFIFQIVGIAPFIFETAFGKLGDSLIIAGYAANTLLQGIDPISFKKTYLTGDAFQRLSIGMAAMMGVLYITIGVPHLLVNTISLVKDLREEDLEKFKDPKSKSSLEILKALRLAFIARQHRKQNEYLTLLAESAKEELKAQNEGLQELTPELEREAEAVIAADQAAKERTLLYQGWKLLKKYSENFRKRFQTDNQETVRWALMHFLFSMSSWNQSGHAYTWMWNTWFMFRSLAFTPVILYIFLAYPEFMSRVTSKVSFRDKEGKRLEPPTVELVIPTVFNGGREHIWSKFKHRMTTLLSSAQLPDLEAFERAVVDVESDLTQIVGRKSFEALMKNITSIEELAKLVARGGVEDFTDPALEVASKKSNIFYRMYFHMLFEETLVSIIRKKVLEADPEAQVSGLFNRDLKNLASLTLVDVESSMAAKRKVNFDKLKISREEIEAEVERITQENNIFGRAKEESERFIRSLSAFTATMVQKAIAKVDPRKNGQVQRWAVVREQQRDPQAMRRAVTQSMVANLTDKPMELIFMTILLSGASGAMLAPLYEEMFGPNSIFYLSRNVYWAGFVSGVVMGVFTSVWWKLQQDQKHQGTHNEMINPKDTNLSYLQYWFKETFQNPNNSMWVNHWNSMSLVFANWKAYLFLFVLIQAFPLERFDFGSYIIGYLIYVLPLSGIAFMIEQGFELSKKYLTRNFKKEHLTSKKVQEYLNKEGFIKRTWFNIFYKVYENILGNLVQVFQFTGTPQFGNRSLIRVIFGGLDPAEYIALSMHNFRSACGWIPLIGPWVVEPVTRVTDSVFTHKFDDWQALDPDRLALKSGKVLPSGSFHFEVEGWIPGQARDDKGLSKAAYSQLGPWMPFSEAQGRILSLLDEGRQEYDGIKLLPMEPSEVINGIIGETAVVGAHAHAYDDIEILVKLLSVEDPKTGEKIVPLAAVEDEEFHVRDLLGMDPKEVLRIQNSDKPDDVSAKLEMELRSTIAVMTKLCGSELSPQIIVALLSNYRKYSPVIDSRPDDRVTQTHSAFLYQNISKLWDHMGLELLLQEFKETHNINRKRDILQKIEKFLADNNREMQDIGKAALSDLKSYVENLPEKSKQHSDNREFVHRIIVLSQAHLGDSSTYESRNTVQAIAVYRQSRQPLGVIQDDVKKHLESISNSFDERPTKIESETLEFLTAAVREIYGDEGLKKYVLIEKTKEGIRKRVDVTQIQHEALEGSEPEKLKALVFLEVLKIREHNEFEIKPLAERLGIKLGNTLKHSVTSGLFQFGVAMAVADAVWSVVFELKGLEGLEEFIGQLKTKEFYETYFAFSLASGAEEYLYQSKKGLRILNPLAPKAAATVLGKSIDEERLTRFLKSQQKTLMRSQSRGLIAGQIFVLYYSQISHHPEFEKIKNDPSDTEALLRVANDVFLSNANATRAAVEGASFWSAVRIVHIVAGVARGLKKGATVAGTASSQANPLMSVGLLAATFLVEKMIIAYFVDHIWEKLSGKKYEEWMARKTLDEGIENFKSQLAMSFDTSEEFQERIRNLHMIFDAYRLAPFQKIMDHEQRFQTNMTLAQEDTTRYLENLDLVAKMRNLLSTNINLDWKRSVPRYSFDLFGRHYDYRNFVGAIGGDPTIEISDNRTGLHRLISTYEIRTMNEKLNKAKEELSEDRVSELFNQYLMEALLLDPDASIDDTQWDIQKLAFVQYERNRMEDIFRLYFQSNRSTSFDETLVRSISGFYPKFSEISKNYIEKGVELTEDLRAGNFYRPLLTRLNIRKRSFEQTAKSYSSQLQNEISLKDKNRFSSYLEEILFLKDLQKKMGSNEALAKAILMTAQQWMLHEVELYQSFSNRELSSEESNEIQEVISHIVNNDR
ncbi:MAG: hypothetical protein HYS98_09040 [Deltaproteobacteria bacterium]|nr:hypothetical protein [Deltaproteobacteria bacterium]